MRTISDLNGFNDAAGLNPRKPYFSASYRNDILRFDTPEVAPGAPASGDIPQMFQAINSTQFLFAGWRTSDTVLKIGAGSFSSSAGSEVSFPTGATVFTGDSNTHAAFRGSWINISNSWQYHFLQYESNSESQTPIGYYSNSSGSSINTFPHAGLPATYVKYINDHYSVRRPSAFIYMAHGDKIAVYTSYEYMSGIAQFVCTMSFYYAPSGSASYRKLRTTVQYEVDEPAYANMTIDPSICRSMDRTSGNVFAASSESGRFFVVANDGTKAVRFTYNNGVEGLLEPILPIDIDANRLEITDSNGAKSYGKYHQFMPTALTKIGVLHYLNGQMTRTYSNGDKRVMEIYLWSTDGVNWAAGDVSSFIDAAYYKRGESVRLWNYALVYPAGGSRVYAIGNDCFTWADAREMDSGAAATDFSSVVIEGEINNATNSADSAQLMVMKGFDTIDPYDLGGKTLAVNLGYYNASGTVKSVKTGEYFVESEEHVLSSVGRGPNKVTAMDLGAWKLTRWSSITDIDRWSSTFVRDDLKTLSKLIVKGISSDYAAVDNATGTGLYLSNLNDPFVGYTSTRDERDGMFTVCARFTDTGSTAKLSAIGLLIGAEDYTDIYTKGAKDRKGFNALMFPASSTWTGHVKTGPQMRKSNLKRRMDNPSTPENESDVDSAYLWTRRYTNLWERDVYIADESSSDGSYNIITSPAATGQGNVIYQAAWAAEHGVDYELVVRRHSGRIQAFARKKGFGTNTIADPAYANYALVYEYQFDKDDRMDWGPRPFWGFAANTDVFCSLDGWNSREYGDIETTLTEAYNTYVEFSDFPTLSCWGLNIYNPGSGHYNTTTSSETTYTWVDREPSSGGGYWQANTTTTTNQVWVSGTANQYYLRMLGQDANHTISVGEIVRCYIFADSGGAFQYDSNNNIIWSEPPNINRSPPGNTTGKSEFRAVVGAIFDDPDVAGAKRIVFDRIWGGNLVGENVAFAIYKVGPAPIYAKALSGTIYESVVTGVDSNNNFKYLNLDIKNGTIKQSTTTAGRAAIVNRQNDAIMLRIIESDGSTHLMHSGSGQTKLGYDWPTNPISDTGFVGNSGLVSTREWRLLMMQGRLFPFSSTKYGLPPGYEKSYMIKGDEIVRYQNWGWRSRSASAVDTVWCMISAYYTPIFPSVKGSNTIQQWSKQSGSSWIEPGDKFNTIPNLSGMRVYINGKGGSYTAEGDVKQYAVSATASLGLDTTSNPGGVASTLTFAPALTSGADSMTPSTERAKDEDKQIKEIAIVSGREQFGTSSGLQSFSDPLCFYPVGPNATEKPNSFIKVNYTTMNAGLYNSAKDNLKYVCNLAGISDVKFMDSSFSAINLNYNSANPLFITSPSLFVPTVIGDSIAHFLLEMTGTFTTSSNVVVNMRNAYVLFVEFDETSAGQFSNRASLNLTLRTAVGFAPAGNIDGGNGSARTIANVVVPVADVPWTGSHDLRVILRKERLMIEIDRTPVWTFDLKTYKFGGAKNDLFDLFTDAAGQLMIRYFDVLNSNSTISITSVELADEVENQVIDMSQLGGDAVQFITRERHIHTRSTQDGGLQFGRFLEGNRTQVDLSKTGGASLTQDFIQDQMEYNPYGVPGHVLVTGAEYGEHLDPEWIRQNGYMFASNQNRLLDTVEDSIREAKLLVRMAKEDSDNSEMQMIGLPHIQPEDELIKDYDFPENTVESQVVSGHAIKFNASTLMSQLKIRKKYALE